MLGGYLAVLAFVKFRATVEASVFIFLIYIMLLLLSRLWTVSTENWFNSIFWWFICFICFSSTIYLIKTPSHIRFLVYLSLIGAIIAGVNLQVIIDDWGNILPRRSVVGHNHNFTSYSLSGVIVIALASSAIIRFPAWFRLSLPFVLLAILYFQLQLGTRGALISSIAAITVYFIRRFASPLLLSSIPALALILSLLISLGSLNFLLGYLDSFSERGTGDLSGRGPLWADAIHHIQKSPVLGIGPGSFEATNLSGVGAHNFFLLIPLETGIFGIVVISVLFFHLFKLLMGLRNPRMSAFLIGIFSAYWFPIASSGHWETSPLSWMVVALFICFAAIYKQEEWDRQRRAFVGRHCV